MSHDPHHHRDHEHSRDERHDRHERHHHGGNREERRGPEGTEFLDLEISKVMYSEAQSMLRDAARELLREAIKKRLSERLGPVLEEIANLATDELVEDVLSNLEIERAIEGRKERSRALDARLREITAKLKRE